MSAEAPAPAVVETPAPRRRISSAVMQRLLLLEIALLFALMCAECAGFVAWAALDRYYAAILAWRAADVPVVVARHELPLGQPIRADDLEVVSFREGFVPDLAVRELELAVGRVPKERILPRDFVREERLAEPGSGEGLTALVGEGMRAVAVVLDDAARVNGQIAPGDHVDVIATLFDGLEPRFTQTVLQGVRVLAVEQHLDRTRTLSQRAWTQVTLEVRPEEAERLAHAGRSGRMRLVLRSPIDFSTVDDAATTTASLLAPPP